MILQKISPCIVVQQGDLEEVFTSASAKEKALQILQAAAIAECEANIIARLHLDFDLSLRVLRQLRNANPDLPIDIEANFNPTTYKPSVRLNWGVIKDKLLLDDARKLANLLLEAAINTSDFVATVNSLTIRANRG